MPESRVLDARWQASHRTLSPVATLGTHTASIAADALYSSRKPAGNRAETAWKVGRTDAEIRADSQDGESNTSPRGIDRRSRHRQTRQICNRSVTQRYLAEKLVYALDYYGMIVHTRRVRLGNVPAYEIGPAMVRHPGPWSQLREEQ